jgi:hypothetical protein
MNWSARGNVLNQYLRNTSIGTTVNTTNIFIQSYTVSVVSDKKDFLSAWFDNSNFAGHVCQMLGS